MVESLLEAAGRDNRVLAKIDELDGYLRELEAITPATGNCFSASRTHNTRHSEPGGARAKNPGGGS